MTDLTPSQWADVDAALERGSVLDAIRVYRTHATCDLVTAKAAVDARRAQLEQEQPERFRQRSGCGMGLILVAVLIGIGGVVTTTVW